MNKTSLSDITERFDIMKKAIDSMTAQAKTNYLATTSDTKEMAELVDRLYLQLNDLSYAAERLQNDLRGI